MDLSFSFGTLDTAAMSLSLPALKSDIVYDVLLIGGGPAALTAAVYTLRKGLITGMLTKNTGGQVNDTKNIRNYMGYSFIDGTELGRKFVAQARETPFDADIGYDAVSIEGGKSGLDGIRYTVVSSSGKRVTARAVIIAAGKNYRKLGVPGEERLTGLGIGYCATCDAPLYAGKKVVVVGGGNSALESALELLGIAESVHLISRSQEVKGDPVLRGRVFNHPRFRHVPNTRVTGFEGENRVERIFFERVGVEAHHDDRSSVAHASTDSVAGEFLPVDGVFIEIGLVPNSGFLKGFIPLAENGEVIVDCGCRTSLAGVFAAGDITTVPEKQIIVAAGEGAKAALSAYRYLAGLSDSTSVTAW